MWIFHKLSEIWGCSEKKRKISKKAEVVPITEKISKKGTNSGTYGQPRLNPREKKNPNPNQLLHIGTRNK